MPSGCGCAACVGSRDTINHLIHRAEREAKKNGVPNSVTIKELSKQKAKYNELHTWS